MANGISVIVKNHFGITGGTGRKIHQHGFQSFGISPGKFVRHSFQLRVEINPTGAGAHRGEAGGQTMVFCAGAFYMLCNITCGSSDNRGNAGSFKSIDIIFFCQQVGGWNCDCANFMQCQNREPELIVALEHQHNHIAFFDAVFDKQVGGLIGIPTHIIEGENFLLPLIIAPDHCAAVRFQAGNFVDHIVGKIKIFLINGAEGF